MSSRSSPRVREHIEKLREAGLDTQRFFDALVGIRDDTALPKNHREAIYKLIAMESFVWYLEAIRNEPVDRMKVRDEVQKLTLEFEAAIRKQAPGEMAATLAQKDLGAAPVKAAPPPAVTVNDRREPQPKPAAPRPPSAAKPKKK